MQITMPRISHQEYFKSFSVPPTHFIVEDCPLLLISNIPYNKSTRADDKEQWVLSGKLGYLKVGKIHFLNKFCIWNLYNFIFFFPLT